MENFTTTATENSTSMEDRYLPLEEWKYGEYLNQSLEYYGRNPNFSDQPDWWKGKYITEACKNSTTMPALEFDSIQLARVIVTWTLFFISAVGNSFVLLCVCRRSRTSHVHMIMLHFAIADLAYTFLVLPMDAMWNTTMQWYGGDILCRLCQMGKQIGMYISSFMVVVMALDRCCGILQPMCTASKQRRRTKYLVGGAWILSIVSAIPPVILFSIHNAYFCPDKEPLKQCVDYLRVDPEKLRPYYFFTMAMSFLVPMILAAICYSLVICEISNMMQRDRVMMGRRDSAVSITRARKKTLKMTALVTLSLLLFWGPYYGYGIYYWFTGKQSIKSISTPIHVLMYFHPAVHPFIYGVLMKDVRDTFKTLMLHIEKIITCSATELSCGDGSFTCLPSTEKTHFSQSNGYQRAVDGPNSPNRVVDETNNQPSPRRRNDDETDRLISSNSEHGSAEEDKVPPLKKSSSSSNGVVRSSRTSQVSFRLPPSEDSEENGTGLNNNKECRDNRDEDVFTTTNV